MNSLDLLVVVSLIMVIVSFVSLSLMFKARSARVRQVSFYIVAALGVYAASVGIRIGNGLFPVQTVIGIIAAVASIGAIILERFSKGDEHKFFIARLTVATSLIIGLLNAFM